MMQIESHSTRKAQSGAQRRWVVWLLAAMMIVFTLFQKPEGFAEIISYVQPVWILLVLLYWSIAIPRSVGLLLPMLAGLVLDESTHSLLGQHSFALLITIFLAQKGYLQLRNLGWFSQTMAIALLVTIYEVQHFWIDTLIARESVNFWRWLPILSTTLLWPPFFILQRSIRRYWNIR